MVLFQEWRSIVVTLLAASVKESGASFAPYGNSFGRPGYNDTYDYIVIGGGNAGNTIAARLALDPANYSVAVLEAGSFYEILDGNRTQIPGYNYINTIALDLGDKSTPTIWGLDVAQEGVSDIPPSYRQGQTFGGTTALNYMAYQRGTAGTFDQWAELVGDDFWSWSNVYPAYKRSVTLQPPDYSKIGPDFNIFYDPSAFDPVGGPLHVSYGNFQSAYLPSLYDAFEASGISHTDGFNSGKLSGYGTATATIDTREATRDTSETSFLQDAASRTSLKIYPQALVTRILFDSQKKATGVAVTSNMATGTLEYVLSARKEVILSGGLWHSPQLLMLSGVGPAETLEKFDIDVVVDLPGVGQGEWFLAGNPDIVASAEADYLNDHSGLLSGLGTGQGMAFEKFPDSYRQNFSKSTLEHLDSFPDDWPEIEFIALPDVPPAEFDISPDTNYIIFGAILLTTKSRGNMTISSASIFDQPIITPNWLIDEADTEQAYAAFQRVREIESNWNAVTAEILPGRNVTSKEDLEDYIIGHAGFLYQGTSTCKMGPKNDSLAVVDSRARVYGVTGLRVVDTSAFPNAPPGHPMSSAYMFAEKIAESILGGN
ncbi:hypothetical protein SCUP234_13403 [Seiridium cupressi]